MPSCLQSSLLYQTGNVSDVPFILTGPVIGMVTATTARILIETNVDCSVECTLTPNNGDDNSNAGRPVKRVLQMRKQAPQSFLFDDLEPECYYRATFDLPTPGLIASGFMTTPKNWSLMDVPSRIAFVSGNDVAYTRESVKESGDLWKNLFKLAFKGQIDYLIHIGNNVCLDTPFESKSGNSQSNSQRDEPPGSRWKKAKAMIHDLPPAQWPELFDDICELFRGAYRETWSHPMTKQTLANVPNLMILNDQEVCRMFGNAESFQNPYSADFFLASCAYEVYNEYQRNLFEDYEPAPDAYSSVVNQAYHFHVLGDIGIMMIDVRAAKSIHHGSCSHPAKDASLPLLGHRQWRDIEFALSDTGYFAGCRMLIVCCPTPPACAGDSGLAAACSSPQQSPPGAWYGQENAPEASYFLAALFDWRGKKPGLRECCIVSGGVGEGFMSDIMDVRYSKLGDTRVDRMKQLVLAPIADKKNAHQNNLLKGVLKNVQTLAPYHQFKHYNHVAKARQFACLDVFLNYDDRLPELGVQTCFSAQVTVTNGIKRTALKAVPHSYRQRANFKSTFLGMCDGTKQLPPEQPLDWDTLNQGDTVPSPPYDLLSRSAGSGEDSSESYSLDSREGSSCLSSLSRHDRRPRKYLCNRDGSQRHSSVQSISAY